MTIHARIKERRLALGILSQKALADLVGVSWQSVQLWERDVGGTAPKRSRIAQVASALQVTPEWLLTGQADPELAWSQADISLDTARMARAATCLRASLTASRVNAENLVKLALSVLEGEL